MTGTLEFDEVRAVVRRALESAELAVESPKVEEDFALEGEFQAEVAAAAGYGERLAGAVAALLDRAAGDAHGTDERERLGRIAAAERAHADLYRPLGARPERPPGGSDPWEMPEFGPAPLEGVAIFWGVVGPFLVLDAGQLAGSVYGPLSRAATVVVRAWVRDTDTGLDRVAELSRHEAGRAAVAAVARSALPLVRDLGEAASGDTATTWNRHAVTGPGTDADRQVLGGYAESAATRDMPGTPR